MSVLRETIRVLDQVNDAVTAYDLVLKEKAIAILLERAFSPTPPSRGSDAAAPTAARADQRPSPSRSDDPEGFAALLRRSPPTCVRDQVLLAAYHLSGGDPARELTSQLLRLLLQAHGIAVANVPRTVEVCLQAAPPLMVQLGKAGTFRHARLRFGITAEGIAAVRRHLRTR